MQEYLNENFEKKESFTEYRLILNSKRGAKGHV